jgi:hypothetical protein
MASISSVRDTFSRLTPFPGLDLIPRPFLHTGRFLAARHASVLIKDTGEDRSVRPYLRLLAGPKIALSVSPINPNPTNTNATNQPVRTRLIG